MTANLYKDAKQEGNIEQFDGHYFDEWYNKETASLMLPKLYKGFYDGRYVNIKDWDFDSPVDTIGIKNFDELFNEENGSLQSSITNNENDIATIKAIKEKQIDVKSFDFDGIKHDLSDCDEIIKTLEEEIALQTNKQIVLDKEAFLFFYEKAGENKKEVTDLYKQYQAECKQNDDYTAIANDVLNTINPFYYGNNSIEDVRSAVNTLKLTHEKKLKHFFKKLTDDKMITNESKDDLYNKVTIFNDKNYTYFGFDTFQNDELQDLSGLTLQVADELNDIKFRYYKRLLEKQLEYFLHSNVK
jgi:hypothetical protein